MSDKLTKTSPGNFEYKDGDGGSLSIQRGVPGSKKGHVYLRMGPQYGVVWIAPDDVEAFVEAVRECAKPTCRHCAGTGVE